MIFLTEKAMVKVREISDENGIGHYSVRVRVIGGGCASFTHDICFDDQVNEIDEVFEMDNVKVICDSLSYQYLEDTVIDYIESPFEGGFKFLSDKIKSSCGCGKSVAY